MFYYFVCKKDCILTLITLYDTNNHANKKKSWKYFRGNIFKRCVWLFVLCQSEEKQSSFLFFDVKGNNLGSSTFISFECKLLIITFKIWWSFSQEKKRKRHDMVKNMFLSLDCKSSSSFWWSCFLPFWCYISLFLVNIIFIFINYWCTFCPSDYNMEKFFM